MSRSDPSASRPLGIVALLSVLIAAIAASAYVARYGTQHIDATGHWCVFNIGDGRFSYGSYERRSLPPQDRQYFVHRNDPPNRLWLTFFLYDHGVDHFDLIFPAWPILLACSIAPTTWLKSRRRSGRGYPIGPLPVQPPSGTAE